MGRVSTTNKEESIRTGKILFVKHNLDCLNLQKIEIDRCKYCKTSLTDKENRRINYYQDKERKNVWDFKNYCSEWCYEMEYPPEIKNVCKECGVSVEPYQKRGGGSSGVYPNYCNEHKKLWKRSTKNIR